MPTFETFWQALQLSWPLISDSVYSWLAGLVLLLALCRLLSGHWRQEVPLVPGWPIVGCAVSFGKDPLAFLTAQRRRYGDIFTLPVLDRKMTFVFDVSLFPIVYHDDRAAFLPAVEQFTYRIFQIHPTEFREVHSVLLNCVRDIFSPLNLQDIASITMQDWKDSFTFHFPTDQPTATVELYDFIRRTMFSSSICTVFHRDMGFDRELYDAFWKLDANFELAASPLPHSLQPGFSRARRTVQKKLKGYLAKFCDDYMNPFNTPPDTQHCSVIPRLAAAMGSDNPTLVNVLMALLWATMANAIPSTFWTLAYILNSPSLFNRLTTELKEKIPGFQQNGPLDCIPYDMLKELPFLKNCISEALRLRTMIIDLRLTVDDIVLDNGKIIPKGNQLCICPALTHIDPLLWENSTDFNPDRWNQHDVPIKYSYVPFGGGFYRCPGQYFALMETQVYVIKLLHHFDVLVEHGGGPGGAPMEVPERIKHQMIGLSKPATPFVVDLQQKVPL